MKIYNITYMVEVYIETMPEFAELLLRKSCIK